MSPYRPILSLALNAAHSAAHIIMEALNRPREAQHKGITDLVTDTDQQSEETIIDMIIKEFPDHGILAEEGGSLSSDSEFTWVIDPLDGTTNFVHGYPSFAVSIGVLYQDQPVVGVVIELPRFKTYTAVHQEGAFCDQSPIHVSPITTLSRSLLVTGFGYNHGDSWSANMNLFSEFTDVTQGVRRLGAAAVDLCHVASGIVDGFWEFDLHPWDLAAGILIVREAGGKVSRMDGGPMPIHDRQLLASNGHLHAAMLEKTSPVVQSLIDQGIEL